MSIANIPSPRIFAGSGFDFRHFQRRFVYFDLLTVFAMMLIA
jgi:hypothetical protein